MKHAYYNEIEPFAVEWIKNLIVAGLVADGDVDDRSILDVRPDDLRGYGQCHFFAGVAVWSHSLRLAGWEDDRPVWTGSCPCQPFSGAGKRAGFSDERHLWPAWFKLIAECRPPVVFGEQVSGAHALPWIDLVFNDMEGSGYACAAVDLPACGVGAPHIRQRHFWVADTAGEGSFSSTYSRVHCGEESAGAWHGEPKRLGPTVRLADATGERRERRRTGKASYQSGTVERSERLLNAVGPVNGFWRASDWIWCQDEKHRPTQPGSRPLATGVTNRVGKLRAYGNSINAEAAKEFIAAYMAVRP